MILNLVYWFGQTSCKNNLRSIVECDQKARGDKYLAKWKTGYCSLEKVTKQYEQYFGKKYMCYIGLQKII